MTGVMLLQKTDFFTVQMCIRDRYSAIYNGQQIKPAVKLYYSGKEVSAADYSVAYSNNVNAGNQAAIQIVGKNAYYGKMSLKFTIKQYSFCLLYTSRCV